MTKKVLVTGAGGNLGRATCQMFADQGYSVIGLLRPGSVSDLPPGVEPVEADLSSESACTQLIEGLRKKHSRLDAAILLAGGFAMGNLQETTSRDLLDMYQLNVLTAFHIVRPVYDWMKLQGGGRIVLAGAKPAVDGGAFQKLAYSLAKGSVIQLASILNENSERDNIVTSVIVPGTIDTPQNREAMPDALFEDWVSPQSLASSILYLLSEEAKALRGTPLLRLYNRS
ncbi:MAG: SDR family NAD(P)-dependent oxidoreductase [Cyclobacteriaceae bacterium]|nr:SDR family NAD(P)-dependent oxidoreductase [Cyclobacteriaceae bacterium]